MLGRLLSTGLLSSPCSHAVTTGVVLHHVDVGTAFLNGPIHEKLSVREPKGFKSGKCDQVLFPRKAVYRLVAVAESAPEGRAWSPYIGSARVVGCTVAHHGLHYLPPTASSERQQGAAHQGARRVLPPAGRLCQPVSALVQRETTLAGTFAWGSGCTLTGWTRAMGIPCRKAVRTSTARRTYTQAGIMARSTVTHARKAVGDLLTTKVLEGSWNLRTQRRALRFAGCVRSFPGFSVRTQRVGFTCWLSKATCPLTPRTFHSCSYRLIGPPKRRPARSMGTTCRRRISEGETSTWCTMADCDSPRRSVESMHSAPACTMRTSGGGRNPAVGVYTDGPTG